MVAIIISSAILMVAILSQAIPYSRKRWRNRPKLVVEIEPNKGITRGSKMIFRATHIPEGMHGLSPETSNRYEFHWNFDLVIRNNSETNAYEVKMCQRKNTNFLDFKKDINPQKALQAHEEVTIPFSFSKIKDVQQKNRDNENKAKPDEFTNLMLQLEYENDSGTKFYSRYYFNTDNTEFPNVRKHELSNWCD